MDRILQTKKRQQEAHREELPPWWQDNSPGSMSLQEAYQEPRPSLEALKRQAHGLSDADRFALMHSLAMSFEAGKMPLNVEKTDGVCGGSACLIRTRIPVWILVSYRRLGWSDEKLLESYPSLRPADLMSAWLYAQAFEDEIKADIDSNDIAD